MMKQPNMILLRRSIITLLVMYAGSAFCQKNQTDWKNVARQHALKSFKEFSELLQIPNDAHFEKDIEKNVVWCERAFQKRGFSTSRLSTETVPLLLAQKEFKGAKKTVLIYVQIDGQPVDFDQWDQSSPWSPTLKEQDAQGNWHSIPYEGLYENPNPNWRIFARSTSDAKGPVAAFLASMDAIEDLGILPNYNLKVIMDFEEELGSPHLPQAVIDYKSDLTADMLIILDGPRHVSNQPTLSFGARGISEITLTVFGPRKPVHSGNYGNYTPNPAMRLAQLLAGMKDDKGSVVLPGFYDGVVLTDAEKAALREVPDDETEILKFLGIAAPDQIGDSFQESLQWPTLNIRGLDALYVGDKVRTLIPDKATAEIDIRLVPSSNPDKLIEIVRSYIAQKGYYLIDREPTEQERLTHSHIALFKSSVSYMAFQTPFESECGQWLRRAMVAAFNKEPIRIRTMGGSIPISPFVTTLGIPAVSIPTVNADNNQHAANENIRVGNYLDAVQTFVAILKEKI